MRRLKAAAGYVLAFVAVLGVLGIAAEVLSVRPMAQGERGTTASYVDYEFEKITVADTAIGVTASKLTSTPPTAARLLVTVETQPIRYRTDGTNPTTTDGILQIAGTSFTIYGTRNISRLRMIRSTGSSATVQVLVGH
jgi:hypothetical protein